MALLLRESRWKMACMVYITKMRVVGGLTLGLAYHRLKKLSTIFGKMWWRVEIIIDVWFFGNNLYYTQDLTVEGGGLK